MERSSADLPWIWSPRAVSCAASSWIAAFSFSRASRASCTALRSASSAAADASAFSSCSLAIERAALARASYSKQRLLAECSSVRARSAALADAMRSSAT